MLYCGSISARRACFLLFSGVPVLLKAGSKENNKIDKLCVLCGSNEQSEWAVSYRIKEVLKYIAPFSS
jgi:hypothetical protein